MKIAEIAAMVSATAFILTVAYVYGFSNAVDVNLLKYFSINDYVKLSVYWLPKFIVICGIGYCIPVPEKILSGRSSKNKNTQSFDMSASTKFFLKYAMLIFFVVTIGIPVVIIIVNIFFNAPKLYWPYCLLGIGLWGFFSCYILIPKYIKEWASWKMKTLIWIPAVIILVLSYGAMTGKSELDSVDEYPTSQLEMTIETPSKRGRVLFALSQYIVFLEQKTKLVEIVPVSQVKTIISIPKQKSKEKKNKKNLEEAKKKRN